MSYVSKLVARVVGAKTARACDGCIRKRARWFCAADDAFLCQSCDSKVHSANPVSSRHERVRLKSASFQSQTDEGESPRGTSSRSVPAYWHNRKARTPRRNLQYSSGFKSDQATSDDDIVNGNQLYLVVPEVMSDETTSFDCQPLLYVDRVPIVLSTSKATSRCFGANEMKGFVGNFYSEVGFVPSDEMDFEEFAADVESLLGKGLDNDGESFGIDGLGLGMMMEVDGPSMMADTTSVVRCRSGRAMIKDEDDQEEEEEEEEIIIMANDRNVFDLCFDYNEEEDEIDKKIDQVEIDDDDVEMKVFSSKKRNTLLRLDYESILSAWDGASPWGSGAQPDFDPNDQCWPTCMTTCQIESHQVVLHSADQAPSTCLNSQNIGLSGDGGREARVSRYREKRRRRLFSKKIRYEVRKLNAEKRPRMKGRFVKRPLPSTSTLSL